MVVTFFADQMPFLSPNQQCQAMKDGSATSCDKDCTECIVWQGGHKPGILRDFSDHGKAREFSGNSVQPPGKIVTNKVFLVCHSNICVTCYIAGVDVEWPLMKVIITFNFCCDNLWKSTFMALEKPGKLGIFSPTLWPPCMKQFLPQFVVLITFCMEAAGEMWCITVNQALKVITSAVVQADQICTDIADMDIKHNCGRTKIDGHRLLLLIHCSLSSSSLRV